MPSIFLISKACNRFSGPDLLIHLAWYLPENRQSNIYPKIKPVFIASAMIYDLKPFRLGPFHFPYA